MPRHLAPPLLGVVASKDVAKLLLNGCQALDRRSFEHKLGLEGAQMFKTLFRWEEPEAPPCLSPTRPPGSPPRPALPKEQVGDDQRVVFEVKVILLIFSRLFPYYLLSSGHCWRGCATSLTLWLSRCSALFPIPECNLDWLLEL